MFLEARWNSSDFNHCRQFCRIVSLSLVVEWIVQFVCARLCLLYIVMPVSKLKARKIDEEGCALQEKLRNYCLICSKEVPVPREYSLCHETLH